MNKKARRKYGAENRQEKAQKASTTRKTGELTQIDDGEGPLASHNDRASGHTPKREVSFFFFLWRAGEGEVQCQQVQTEERDAHAAKSRPGIKPSLSRARLHT